MIGIKPPTIAALVISNFIIIALYWVIVPYYIPGLVAILAQSMRALVSSIIVLVYGLAIFQMVRKNSRDPSYVLILGIWIAWAAELYQAILALIWRYNDKPDWGYYSFWFFGSYMTILAALHHIAIPEAIDGRIPYRNIVFIAVIASLCGLILGIAIGVQYPPLNQLIR